MESNHKSVFIDTNTFLQLKDLKDLDWCTIFEFAQRIDLIVASSVIKELDQFKVSDRNRLRNRARKALKLIDEASREVGFSVLLRANPEVWLALAPQAKIDWTKLSNLDPNKPDDVFVAEALTYGADEVEVLSHDTGPRVSARQAGIRAHSPPDHWLLKPEPTREDRKVKELEAELARSSQTRPQIEACFGSLTSPAESYELIIPVLPPLDATVQRQLLARFLDLNPPHSIRATPGSNTLAFLTQDTYSAEQKRTYLDEYRNFRTRAEIFFATLHSLLRSHFFHQCIPFEIQNTSIVAAASLKVEARLNGKAAFINSEDFAPQIGLPVSPKKPRPSPPLGTAIDYDLLSRSIPTLANPRRDPTGFYWEDFPDGLLKHCSLHCDDFRATEIFEDDFWIQIGSDFSREMDISIRISATNLAQPVRTSALIRIEEEAASWTDPRILDRLPPLVQDILGEA
tara:strand:- start:1054 stop:2424 length:1371 start_codon:yes stop_codon:yes gene_type:complete